MNNSELREEISHNFEKTGLVTNVKVYGRLYDGEDPLRLEYQISQKSSKTKKNLAEVRILKRQLTNIIQLNHPEIKGIEEQVIKKDVAYKQIVVPNPEAKNNEDSEERILYDLNHYLKNYLMKKHR